MHRHAANLILIALACFQPNDAAHAHIAYTWDAADNLTTVTGPRNLTTEYAYTGFDELSTLTSPDTGITEYEYDPAGNLKVQTDARNQRGLYTYDAANRLTQIQYGLAQGETGLASIEETLSFAYDEAAGGEGALGRLTHANVSGIYGSNQLAYQYDAHGRPLCHDSCPLF